MQTNFEEELWKIHYYEAGSFEEELLIFMPNLLLMTHSIFLGANSEYNEWYLKQNGKEYAYLFVRSFLELMGSNYPPVTHWVMKTPLHPLYPDTLLDTFPDARIIVPHRDPAEVIPSWSKLCAYVMAHYYKETDTRFCFDAKAICRNVLDHMRSEERRVGKECDIPCISRWSPYH